MSEPCFIDEVGPMRLVTPDSVAELCATVRGAAENRQAIYPLGGRTSLHVGRPPARPGLAVALGKLDQLIDYPARDMTITVQAGLAIEKLQAILRSENQRLPIDVPLPDQATVGGALAANISGPRRYGFGTLRDYVIGITVINDLGQETKAGGRVVKNVAGYDLCKLHIGALGTLGVISQVTFKLRPHPEATALLVVAASADQVATILDLAHASQTRPVCIELLNRAAAQWLNRLIQLNLPDTPWIVIVGFEDNHEAVTWQVTQATAEFQQVKPMGLEACVGSAAEPLWKALTELPVDDETGLTFKANLLPSATAAFCQQAVSHASLSMLQAHAGNGIVLGQLPQTTKLEEAESCLHWLRGLAVASQGNLTVLRCPTAWKDTLPIWGEPRGDRALMHNVKVKLDPKGIFNPGRFLEARGKQGSVGA